jgi:hypothetical protein
MYQKIGDEVTMSIIINIYAIDSATNRPDPPFNHIKPGGDII